MNARSTAAVDSRSSQSAMGSSVNCAKLRAKARVDWARGPSDPSMLIGSPSTKPTAAPFGRELKDARDVAVEALASNGLDRRSDAPIRIARGDPDGLAAEIKTEQRTTLPAAAPLRR